MNEELESRLDKIMGAEIAGTYRDERTGIDVEIKNVTRIDGGIEVYARAWKDEQAIGFGRGGRVEIERIVIMNPAIYVPDGTTKVERTEMGGEYVVKNMVEDVVAAVRFAVARAIGVVGKNGDNIIKGLVGKTTMTFYPDSSATDGAPYRLVGGETWAQVRNNAGTGVDTTSATFGWHIQSYAGAWYTLARAIISFNTTALALSKNILSGVISLNLAQGADGGSCDGSVNVYESTPANPASLVAADYQQIGSTECCDTAVSYTDVGGGGFFDFALNSVGLANIAKEDISMFGLRNSDYDVANTQPWNPASLTAESYILFSRYINGAYGPQLILEVEEVVPITEASFNIKTIDGVAILLP